jgi:hypothetical protein
MLGLAVSVMSIIWLPITEDVLHLLIQCLMARMLCESIGIGFVIDEAMLVDHFFLEQRHHSPSFKLIKLTTR